MLLRMSTLFLRTLREDPADAEVPSHRLLVRAGYIRRAAPGIYSWLPLGWRVLPQRRAHRPRGDGRDGRPGGALPRAAAPRAVRGDRPLDRVRRQHLPAQGPQGRRLPARPDARGDVHPAGEGPVLLVQGPAAVDLPDPDQVPRRGASAGRHPARPRVRHEGLVLLRRRRRRSGGVLRGAPRGLHHASSTGSGSTTSSSSAMSGAMGGSASEEFLQPAENGEDTFVRCDERRLRRQRRGGASRRCRRRATATTSGRRTSRTRPTPRRSRPSSPWPTSGFPRADGRAWTAADTLKNVVVMLRPPRRQPRAARRRPARRPRGRHQAAGGAVAPAEVEPFTERTSTTDPQLVKGYIGPAALGGEDRRRSATCSTRGSSPAPRWITGAERAGPARLRPGRRPRLRPATASSRPPRSATATRARSTAAALEIARGIEIGHIFQLGRKYAEALGLKVLDENGKLVTVTMGSLRHRRRRAVAAVAEPTLRRARPVLAARRSRPPTSTSWPPARTTRCSTAARALSRRARGRRRPRALRRPARRSRPGVKFKDAELIGVPTIVVVGRGLADGVVEVRDRRTGEREESPWRRPSPALTRHRSAHDGGRRRLRLGRHADAVAHDRLRATSGCATPTPHRRPAGGRTSSPNEIIAAEERRLAAAARAPAAAPGSARSSPRPASTPTASGTRPRWRPTGVLGAAHPDGPGRPGAARAACASGG